jgi:predicted RNase H-like HicB family nuclease
MKQQLLQEPPISTAPQAETPYASTPRGNANQLTEIMSSINEAVEKYTEELLSDSVDLPPEMSTFMQV